jgi:outer membrane putative beta-barrel porin/alpha-amylase
MTALRTTLVALSFALLTAVPALAGPPLITDDAGTVDVGKAEIELNGSSPYDKKIKAGVVTKNSSLDTEAKITTGLCKDLGVSLAIPYTVSARVMEDDVLVGMASGLGDMALEIKYVFAELAGINFAIKPTVIVPTGRYSAGLSEGRWQFGTTLIATREFEDGKYALHVNLGYERHDYRTDEVRESTRSNLWSGSVAGETRLMKGLTVVLDFGLATNTDRGSDQLPAYALTGVRYEINDHLDINAGVKAGLTEPEDDFTALYGLVLKF